MEKLLFFVCSLFDLILLYIYMKETMPKRKVASTFVYGGAFVLDEVILTMYTALVSVTNNITMQNYLNMLISLLLVFVLTFLHEGTMKQRFFITITFQVVATLAELIVGVVFSFLPEDLTELLMGNEVYGALCSKIVMFLFINIIILYKKKGTTVRNHNYTALVLLMPILSLFLLLAITVQYKMNNMQSTISMICGIGILAANVVNYFLLQNFLKVQEMHEIETNLERQIEYQTVKYQQLSTAYRDTRRLIHDTKKHYFYIKNCVDMKKYSEISPYLDESITDMEKTFISVNTGNLVIDSFVSNYDSISKQEGIQFRTDIQISPNSIKIKDYELSIILGNLLDNALAACRLIEVPNPRQITVEVFTTSQELVIHISNTTQDNKSKRSEIEQLNHGFGTQNVEMIVMQYDGNYTYCEKKGIYDVIVSIPFM